MTYTEQYQSYVKQIEDTLAEIMEESFEMQSQVAQAAKYSLFSGGKRVRGVLCMAICNLLDGDTKTALAFASALEMVHAYSLIHDDLPCMDNADLRRGKPSCHKAFDEATALLAGDALLTHAFEVLGNAPSNASTRIQAVQALSCAIGTKGMIYGQELDLESENATISTQQLHQVHELKTGKLMIAAVQLGLLTSYAAPAVRQDLEEYAKGVGLVFQMVDDLLDVTCDTQQLGKPAGSDCANGKSTFITLYGIEQTQKMVEQVTHHSCNKLNRFVENGWFLRELAQELSQRKK